MVTHSGSPAQKVVRKVEVVTIDDHRMVDVDPRRAETAGVVRRLADERG